MSLRLPPRLAEHLFASSGAAASFDPFTLMIRFLTEQPYPKDNLKAIRKIISEQPASIIAHEIAHFFQMTATTYGIRRFGVFIEELQVKLHLIAILSKRNGGRLVPPIHDELAALSKIDEEIGNLLDMYHSAAMRALQLDGGIYFLRDILEDAIEVIPGLLFAKALTKNDEKSPAIILLDMVPFTGDNKILWFGAKHVMEGGAAAIQLIQSRLGNERSSMSAQLGPGRKVSSEALGALVDPYFVSNMLYSMFTSFPAEVQKLNTLEEFYILTMKHRRGISTLPR